MEHNFEKEFISYEQALHLKKLGFTDPCFAIYYSKDKSFSWHNHKHHTNDEPILDSGEFNISAPVHQQAFKWLQQQLEIQRGIMDLDEEEREKHLNRLIKNLRIQNYEP